MRMQTFVFSSDLTLSSEEVDDNLARSSEVEYKQTTQIALDSFNEINSSSSSVNSSGASNEIITYCQNFNRMRSAAKLTEIHRKVSGCAYSVILGTETSWDESIRSEEIFGNNYNVYRADRHYQWSEKP